MTRCEYHVIDLNTGRLVFVGSFYKYKKFLAKYLTVEGTAFQVTVWKYKQ